MSAVVICLLAVVMLGADPSSRFNKVGHEMICTCGCGQVLLECNHVGCPVSPVMINELHAQMDGGGSDTLILNWFAAKYGRLTAATAAAAISAIKMNGVIRRRIGAASGKSLNTLAGGV